MVEIWFAIVGATLVFALLAWWFMHRTTARADAQAAERERLLQRELELEQRALARELEHRFKQRETELEQRHERRQIELRQKEDEAVSALLAAEKEKDLLEKRRASLDEQITEAEAREDAARERLAEYRHKLLKLADATMEDARAALREEAQRECDDEIRLMREERLQRSIMEVEDEARKILIASMQRLSGQANHDLTATIVKLPSEDLKGRIIGREGRNIKSFESVTGTTLLIDETPDSVLISSFDPVRRETARLALEALLRDGRIHPASIEEAVEQAEEELKRSVIAYGEDAVRKLRLNKVHPEVIGLLGRMHYRLANNQNSLDHSIEVANLCALMAAELRLDPDLAKRCGLFHDIGKVLDEEYPGSHAMAGANFLKRYGQEDPRTINAVAAHHGEIPAESAYVGLLMTADSLSAMRPGARAESIDGYIQRVRRLEEIARDGEGIKESYALQAGREIRVIVDPGKIDDLGARRLATRIRRRVEDELQYPGTIRVTVIRESRISETAK
ncbi:MAG: ribonuclease Y [Opitutales bacterium]